MAVKFEVGDKFRIVDYSKDQYGELEIVSRNGKWVTVLIGDKQIQARAYEVRNPFSESLLLEGYSPVFSYNSIKDEEDFDYDNDD